MRRGRLVAPLLALALLLTGCAEQGPQVSDGQDVGGVTEWKHPTTPPVAFSGPTVTGSTFRSVDHRGGVVVVNFWFQDCPPCNAEAPVLSALSKRFQADGVQFVGVNTRDGTADAGSFERQYGIGYPSILDQSNHGAAQFAFQQTVLPGAIPGTIVLDRQGRVVARIVGQADRSTLQTLIQDAVDGSAA